MICRGDANFDTQFHKTMIHTDACLPSRSKKYYVHFSVLIVCTSFSVMIYFMGDGTTNHTTYLSSELHVTTRDYFAHHLHSIFQHYWEVNRRKSRMYHVTFIQVEITHASFKSCVRTLCPLSPLICIFSIAFNLYSLKGNKKRSRTELIFSDPISNHANAYHEDWFSD